MNEQLKIYDFRGLFLTSWRASPSLSYGSPPRTDVSDKQQRTKNNKNSNYPNYQIL